MTNSWRSDVPNRVKPSVFVWLPGRSLWPGWQDVPQCAWSLALCLQAQHGRRQGAHPRVLLSARVPAQRQQLRPGSVSGSVDNNSWWKHKIKLTEIIDAWMLMFCLPSVVWCTRCQAEWHQAGWRDPATLGQGRPPGVHQSPQRGRKLTHLCQFRSEFQWVHAYLCLVLPPGCRRWSATTYRPTSTNGSTWFSATSSRVRRPWRRSMSSTTCSTRVRWTSTTSTTRSRRRPPSASSTTSDKSPNRSDTG